jgi:hypothetical protein
MKPLPDTSAPLRSSAALQFLYVKIPLAAGVADPFHRLENRLDHILQDKGIGSVAGWGDSLDDRQSGIRAVAFSRIDIDVTDIGVARVILHTALPELGAAAGTEIHYSISHKHYEDVYTAPGWLLEQAS